MTQSKQHTPDGLQADDYMFGKDALIERLQAEKMELLEALEDLFLKGRNSKTLDKAVKAIVKAEGQS